MDIVILLASVLAAAPPILFAVLGETITEKAGVINLSLDGSILLSAMTAFIVATTSGSLLLGMIAAMLVGALVAGVIAVISLTLHQPQVATGFILTLLTRDLAYVLGNAYTRVPGPQVQHLPIPGLANLPVIGRIVFDQDPMVYLSLLAIFLVWFYMNKTQPGLKLQGLGERPAAAFARGVNVTRMRYVYTLAGGALVGLGGATFSLLVKPGWARPYGIEGTGWIALAIVIFGGWRPLRAAVGAYAFVTLQTLANTLQSAMPNVPTQLFPTLPFPLMILTLVLVTLGNAEWLQRSLGRLPEGLRRVLVRSLRALQTSPPAALGTVFEQE
ncbi:ABC transporter permease [Candidatus Amarolinea aalborgensis]|jgi:simple sugar transport system permease protein|uniref:ABC transporter permease n=1 Tax=Candidatus Amarolinea aalborgensis TaxID=2249329 RepID=UPI003BF99C86